MAVYPPSAARGFIAEKLNIPYDNTEATFGEQEDTYIVSAADKNYVLKGEAVLPAFPTGACGEEKWEFEILEENNKEGN